MDYVLHYAPDNASLIVRMALDKLGLPYRCALVDRATRAQQSEAYLRLNPNGLIPVLETPQGPLFETGAILLWLADTHGGLGPAPDHPERGNFLKWLFFLSNTLHPSLRMLFYPDQYAGPDPALRAAFDRLTRTRLREILARLDAAAATGPDWLGGPEPSALDLYLAACLRWCALYPVTADRSWFRLADTPRLHAICTRLESQPFVAAAQAAEGLGATPFTNPSHPNPPEGSAT